MLSFAGIIAWFRGTWLGRALAFAGVVLLILLGAYHKGRRDQKQTHRVDDLETANDVRSRAARARREHDVAVGGTSHADLVERMRGRNRLRDE